MTLLAWLAVLASAGWVVLAAVSLADSALPTAQPLSAPGPAGESAPTTVTLPPPTPLTALPELHLLGSAPALALEAAPEQAPAPIEPPVALELTGVLPGPAAASGLAIVGTPAGQQESYRVGAELPGGARLVAVDASGVTLDRNGQPERIDLPQPSLEPAHAPVVPPELLRKPATAAAPPPPVPSANGDTTTANARQKLREARERLEAARKVREQRAAAAEAR